MRNFGLICVLLFFVGQAQAQSPLTDCFQLLRPELTISVFRDFANTPLGHACDPANGWNMPLYYGSAFMCESWINTPIPAWKPIGGGYDATGAFYQLTPNRDQEPDTMDVVRGTDNTTEAIARTQYAQVMNLAVDSTNGRVYLGVRIAENTCGTGATGAEGIVAISGLPTMFDTLLTFVPDGTLAALTPAHPDGFRSADSLQLWAGDVATLPDWSRAQPVTCRAATSPTPGQVVSIADPLPNPAVGDGRYYVTAVQHGPDRRLGRQYVNGSFSARNPAALHVCD